MTHTSSRMGTFRSVPTENSVSFPSGWLAASLTSMYSVVEPSL